MISPFLVVVGAVGDDDDDDDDADASFFTLLLGPLLYFLSVSIVIHDVAWVGIDPFLRK